MQIATDNIRRWRENPVAFAYEVCKFDPDHWQREALEVFPSQDEDKKRMSLQACTGPGKTAVQTIMGWNFLACYGGKGEHPRGFCISVTEDNLKSTLWPEFSIWQQRSDYLKAAFTWRAERIFANDHPETWFLEARTWSKKADKEAQGRTLSGLHGPYVFVDLDEAGDIPVPVLKSGEQIFSSQYKWAKLVMGGNPTSLEGALYHAATIARANYYIIRITGDPDDPKRSPRVNLQNAIEQIRLYGRDNPWVMATILGQFPPSSINALLGIEEVQAAMNRTIEPAMYEWAQKRIGVDVARFGNDRTIMFPRQGLRAFKPAPPMRNMRTTDIAARVAQGIEKWNKHAARPQNILTFVDDTGHWGHGVIDNLITAQYTPIPVIYHGPAIDPRYKNKTTEMHFAMAEWVKAGGCLPNVPDLMGELTSRTYTFSGGKLVLEDKDLAKARLGRSPDYSDALANTFALPDMPAEYYPGLQKKSVADHDWDPAEDPEDRLRRLGVARY